MLAVFIAWTKETHRSGGSPLDIALGHWRGNSGTPFVGKILNAISGGYEREAAHEDVGLRVRQRLHHRARRRRARWWSASESTADLAQLPRRQRCQSVQNAAHKRPQMNHAVRRRSYDHDAQPQGTQILLVLKASIHAQQDIETPLSMPQQLTVRRPGPARGLHGADLVSPSVRRREPAADFRQAERARARTESRARSSAASACCLETDGN